MGSNNNYQWSSHISIPSEYTHVAVTNATLDKHLYSSLESSNDSSEDETEIDHAELLLSNDPCSDISMNKIAHFENMWKDENLHATDSQLVSWAIEEDDVYEH